MRNFSIYRSGLSNEKITFLSQIKRKTELNKEDNTPKIYKRKEKELDILWQGFRVNPKEEKSPGIYLLTGFIAGALCMFIMNSILSISSGLLSSEVNPKAMGQPKFEKKISRREKIPQIKADSNVAVVPVINEISPDNMLSNETYTVKSGDSMSTIVYKFYGKYDTDKIEKIKEVNNLKSANKLSVGQKLVIPLDE